MKILQETIKFLALGALLLMSTAHSQVYQESGGLVIMEAENTPSPLGQWVKETSLTGYTGTGFLRFTGNAPDGGTANSPLEYSFKINQTGLYYLHIHCAKKRIDGRTDLANDAYVRVVGDYNAGPGPFINHGDNASITLLKNNTKYYGGNIDAWKWEDGEAGTGGSGNLDPGGDTNKRIALYEFKAGQTYKLVVSGRSQEFRINRFMFRLTSVPKTTAHGLNNQESSSDGSAPPPVGLVYQATTDFPSITSGQAPYYIDTARNALAIDASETIYRDKFARATLAFNGATGTYNVTISALGEIDGESTFRLLVNGAVVGTARNTRVTVDYVPQNHTFSYIAIPTGATLAVESDASSNSIIPEGTGFAYSRGRWTTLTLAVSESLTPFNRKRDILIAQFDNKPDEDDIHAQAALGSMLRHPDLRGVKVYAVQGAYGKQGGTFLDSTSLFNLIYGPEGADTWTHAHTNWNLSVTRIVNKVKPILLAGGNVWVQEAGQSDITADWIRALIADGIPETTVKNRVNIIQHSQWNIDQTTTADLNYVIEKANFVKIPDGNTGGNGTPGYNTATTSWLNEVRNSTKNPEAKAMWLLADQIIQADPDIGNNNIRNGGVDFSDCVENWRIFNIGSNADTIREFWDRYVVNEPLGRIAVVSDGNYRDTDDMAAIPIELAMLIASGNQNRLVHFSHSCDLVSAVGDAGIGDETDREAALQTACDGTALRWGAFPNVTKFYNCKQEKSATIANLTSAIEASSSSDPLWIVEAGEPDIIYEAVNAASAAKREFVRIITHSSVNDTSGDTYDLADIIALPGVGASKVKYINDQNANLKTDLPTWYWARDHSDSRINWLWERGFDAQTSDWGYASIRNFFDCSDAGMVWYWLSGVTDEDCTVDKLKTLFTDFVDDDTTYTLSETSTNGSISFNPPGGVYTAGTVVTVTAKPDTGYMFNGWSGDLTVTNNPATITINGNKSITANFIPDPTITETFTTSGTWVLPEKVSRVRVECRGAGGAGGSAKVVSTGTTQARGGGGAGGSYAKRIIDVSAFPVGTQFTVTVGAGGVPNVDVVNHNEVSPSQTGGASVFSSPSVVELVKAVGGVGGGNALRTTTDHTPANGAIGSTGNSIGDVKWAGGNGGTSGTANSGQSGGGGGGAGDASSGGNGGVITAGVGGVSGGGTGGVGRGAAGPPQTLPSAPGGGGGAVVATEASPLNIAAAGARGEVKISYAYQVTLSTNAVDGTITLNPPPTGGTYETGTVVTVTANPNPGYDFSGWSGDLSGATSPATLVMDGNKSIVAVFAPAQITSFTEVGTHDWVCPPGVTWVTVECWGGGGAAGSVTSVADGTTQARSGGGAGGSYSRTVNLPVTPGGTYKVIVGAGGTPVSTVTIHNTALAEQGGGDSKFTNAAATTELVKATGGAGGRNAIKTSGTVNVIGGAGSTAGCIGGVVFPGGNGGNAGATSVGGTGAGGGGGGAGNASPGGSPTFAITGGAGGTIGGGSGGTARGAPGPIQSTAGTPGGGGGGVVVSESGVTNIGGAGGSGKVVLSLVDPDPFATWADPEVAFDADTNKDGLDNGLAWFLGAGSHDENAAARLPKPTQTSNALVLEFDCLHAADRGSAVFEVQYGQLDDWAGTVIPGTPGTYTDGVVDFVITDPEPAGGLLKVVATIPASEAAAGGIFGRIRGVK